MIMTTDEKKYFGQGNICKNDHFTQSQAYFILVRETVSYNL